MAQTALPAGFRITDSNDEPYSGARLFFYDAETLDHRTVYQDAALTVAHAQPVVCDGGGLVPTIYVPTGLYRVIITNSDQSFTVDDQDNIDGPIDTASLTTTEAKPITAITSVIDSGTDPATSLGGVVLCNPGGGNFTRTLPAASNGNGKRITYKNIGTTGSVILDAGVSTIDGDAQRILTNRYQAETYVSDGSDWHIDTSPPRFPMPQGRLSLVSGVPFATADQASKSEVFWAFDEGNICPVKFGSAMVSVKVETEPIITLNSSNNLANTIYDVFGILNAGSFALGTIAWNASGAGVGSRGAGGGTAELVRSQGVLVNANAITLRNGASTYSVAAQEGTYIGSIFIDTTAGQLTTQVSYGQSRKYGLWNAYNRRNIILKAGDSTVSWTYGVDTYRAVNSDNSNKVTVFSGLAEEVVSAQYMQRYESTLSSGQSTRKSVAIGWNSTTAASGLEGNNFFSVVSSNYAIGDISIGSFMQTTPFIGINDVQAIEKSGSSSADTMYGGEDECILTTSYMG